ncbi:MAG TPA: 2-oxoglutarate dehydrogenase E1 component [Bacteriovoracaceae bacterium]|nr:2-oxoglutarate dehydrogenase E1 component [Bacteriovoracaceae bacterium]
MTVSHDYSYVSSSDNSFIDSLYNDFKKNPESVDPGWKQFFLGVEFALNKSETENPAGPTPSAHNLSKEFKVFKYIEAFRSRAHLVATTNPIRERVNRFPKLDLDDHGLTIADLDSTFLIGETLGLKNAKLKDILAHLKNIYCGAIGVEYMHINDSEIRDWFQLRFENGSHDRNFGIDKKKRILTKLNEAVAFENFLHTKYVGQKRFSLEGGENTIPALDAIINSSAKFGVEEVVIGMAHRGRLNVLANIMGKTYEYIFNEFEGQATPDLTMGDGDVKYHMGYSSHVSTMGGQKVYLKLMPNPSHLEAVDAVVLGYTRAQGDSLYNENPNKLLPIIIHGDAAVAGQGIVYETVQMSGLKGYNVGGAIHFVINNQIGFTTDFDDARSSIYSTSVARVLETPVIHVNGDDAEAVVYAVELASEFRAKFHKDIFVDMVCYRKYGHNESDEPRFTQPKFYKLISSHSNAREIYKDKLIEGKQIEAQLVVQMEEQFKNLLQDRFNMVKQKPLPYLYQKPEEQWQKFRRSAPKDFDYSPETAVSRASLEKTLRALTTLPENIKPIQKIDKLLEERSKRFNEDQIDWAMAELMSYGSLLQEGINVRMSGQDCIRGTFSHRHAGVVDEVSNTRHLFLSNISDKQGLFKIYNSLLSEYAVLGFEYGYSLGSPTSLNLWEAQFGDFANGAQTIIDQFISSGESKWQRQSGVVMLLPHGYEGQGPEHSNARPERFLQLAAEWNIVVANLTTPANIFHILRRQIKWNFRKPLVIFTPKSLLRHPECISKVSDLTEGGFQEIIDDPSVNSKDVKRLVMCSGKVYYDLKARQIKDKRKDVAIVRLEQLYPMPEEQSWKLLEKYKGAQRVWVQEEPKNMGAFTFLRRYQQFDDFKLIARKSSASPATGYASVHAQEQAKIIGAAFAENIETV